MHVNSDDSDKRKILQRLSIARDFINTLINEDDFEKNWLAIHKVLSLARNQIAIATHIMARRHVRHCLERRQSDQSMLNPTQEIIKTFNYLS